MGIYVHLPSITCRLHLESSSVTNSHEVTAPPQLKKASVNAKSLGIPSSDYELGLSLGTRQLWWTGQFLWSPSEKLGPLARHARFDRQVFFLYPPVFSLLCTPEKVSQKHDMQRPSAPHIRHAHRHPLRNPLTGVEIGWGSPFYPVSGIKLPLTDSATPKKIPTQSTSIHATTKTGRVCAGN